MADWGNVQQGLVSGYQVGRSAGGKLSGLGMALNKIATQLRTQREAGEEMGRKVNLLGSEEASRMRLLEKEYGLRGELAEKETKLKPTTEPIVDEFGNIIGERPVGSVFQPRKQEINITSSDIKEAQKLVPFWEKLLPGTQTQAGKDVTALRKTMVEKKLGRIKVKVKESGLTGTIEANEFDSNIYEKL